MAVLIIDDRFEPEKWVERVQRILGSIERPNVKVFAVRDYPSAQKYLENPTYDIGVILLDQLFEAKECKLIGDDLEPARGATPHLQHTQGLLIARRISRDLGPLRPAVLMFTSAGSAIDEAAMLREEGIIDGYQGKPAVDAPESHEARSLARFLQREFHPVREVFEAGDLLVIDQTFGRFLDLHICDWRRDAMRTIEAVLQVNQRQAERVLDVRSWQRARAAGELPNWRQAWENSQLWDLLLRRWFGSATAWAFQGETCAPRLRYYFIDGAASHMQRVVVFLDPRFMPDLSPTRRGELETLPEFIPSNGLPPAFNIFRVRLPHRAPGSFSPYLLGVWFDTTKNGDWIPLSVLRHQSIASGIRAPLAAVVHAIDLGSQQANASGQIPQHGWGLLADGVLINREATGHGPWHNWHCPFWPVQLLGLHSDPEQETPLSVSYFRQRLNRLGWLHALSWWFAFGELPIPLDQGQLPQLIQARQRLLQSLVNNQSITIPIASWWGETDTNDTHVRRSRETLHMRRRFRCLGATNAPPLGIRTRVTLAECTIILDQENQAVFEQLHFEQQVVLQNCRVQLADGTPAPMVLKDCVFAGGLQINKADATKITLRDCLVPETAMVEILNTQEIDLQLVDVVGSGTVHLHRIRCDSIRLRGSFANCTIGPGVRCGTLNLERTEGTALLDRVHIAERLTLNNPDTQTTASISVRSCTVGDDVTILGLLDVMCSESHFNSDLICEAKNPLSSLTLRDVQIIGTLDLHECKFNKDVILEDCLVTQRLRAERASMQSLQMQSSNCVGAMLFSGVTIRDNLCISQPHGSDQMTGVIFRDQLDFSGATFGGVADFSHTIVSQEVKFEQATFRGRALFSNLQSGGNLLFGKATFTQPPDFSQLTCNAVVRLCGVRWTGSRSIAAATFRGAIIRGVLDLGSPLDAQGNQHAEFWVDLLDATTDRMVLDEASMALAMRAAQGTPEQQMRLARLYESALLKEMQFDKADNYYREAKNLEPGRWNGLKDQIWKHGTDPLQPLRWLGAMAVILLAYLLAISWILERSPGETAYQWIGLFQNLVFIESPKVEGFPWWVQIVPGVCVGFGAILMNLFFAALARKLLR